MEFSKTNLTHGYRNHYGQPIRYSMSLMVSVHWQRHILGPVSYKRSTTFDLQISQYTYNRKRQRLYRFYTGSRYTLTNQLGGQSHSAQQTRSRHDTDTMCWSKASLVKPAHSFRKVDCSVMLRNLDWPTLNLCSLADRWFHKPDSCDAEAFLHEQLEPWIWIKRTIHPV